MLTEVNYYQQRNLWFKYNIRHVVWFLTIYSFNKSYLIKKKLKVLLIYRYLPTYSSPTL